MHDRLRSVIVECLDWRQCLDRYDRAGTLMYIDPPYPENGCNYRHNMRTWAEHEELAARLQRSTCQWLYSSYDTPQIHALFPDASTLSVQSASGMNTEKNGNTRVLNREVLIANFNLRGQEPLVDLPEAQALLKL